MSLFRGMGHDFLFWGSGRIFRNMQVDEPSWEYGLKSEWIGQGDKLNFMNMSQNGSPEMYELISWSENMGQRGSQKIGSQVDELIREYGLQRNDHRE